MKASTYITTLLIGILLAALLSSCRSTSESLRDPATAHIYRTGYPEVQARVAGHFDKKKNTYIKLYSEFSLNSLIFVTRDGESEARLRINIYVRDVNDSNNLVKRITEDISTRDAQNIEGNALLFDREMAIGAGDYEISLMVQDLSSDKTTPATLLVSVPDPKADTPTLTDISVSNRIDGSNYSIPSNFIASNADSLSFNFLVSSNSDSFDELIVTKRFIRINSDTDFPRPISHLNIPSGSIAYRGIDYNDQKELYKIDNSIEARSGIHTLELIHETPARGVYRIEAVIHGKQNDEKTIIERKFRDIIVLSPNFPNIRTTRDMIDPLYYLMDRREFQRIRAIEDPDSLRAAFEAFWLSNIRNPSRAAEVIELYYTRVEEANRAFTTFREGWMTDMGMVYILVGPPVHIENTIDSMIWYYDYNRMDVRTVFRFERARYHGASFPFHHYILVRQRFYHEIELNRIQDWRTGRILSRRSL